MKFQFKNQEEKKKRIEHHLKEIQHHQDELKRCYKGECLTQEEKPHIPTAEEWYEVYPKKVDPKPAKAKYGRLKDHEKLACMERSKLLRRLVERGAKELQYLKGAAAFVNQKAWLSELDEGASQIRNPAYSSHQRDGYTSKNPEVKKATENKTKKVDEENLCTPEQNAAWADKLASMYSPKSVDE